MTRGPACRHPESRGARGFHLQDGGRRGSRKIRVMTRGCSRACVESDCTVYIAPPSPWKLITGAVRAGDGGSGGAGRAHAEWAAGQRQERVQRRSSCRRPGNTRGRGVADSSTTRSLLRLQQRKRRPHRVRSQRPGRHRGPLPRGRGRGRCRERVRQRLERSLDVLAGRGERQQRAALRRHPARHPRVPEEGDRLRRAGEHDGLQPFEEGGDALGEIGNTVRPWQPGPALESRREGLRKEPRPRRAGNPPPPSGRAPSVRRRRGGFRRPCRRAAPPRRARRHRRAPGAAAAPEPPARDLRPRRPGGPRER